jgi:membrane protein YdbS with pleckstrin-like domain
MKKRIYSALVALLVGAGCYALIGWGLGPKISVMAKLFLVFFGVIVVLQILPATVLFLCMLKEMFFRTDRTGEVGTRREKRAQ